MNSILEVEKAEILPKSKDSLGTQVILVRGGKKKNYLEWGKEGDSSVWEKQEELAF